MSAFDRLEAAASRTIDAANSTTFVLTPMRGTPNGRAGPDPERAILTGRAVFDFVEVDPALQLDNRKAGGSNDFRTLVGGQEPVASIDIRYLPQMPRQGDSIMFGSRPSEAYQVTSARPDGQSRVELRLARL